MAGLAFNKSATIAGNCWQSLAGSRQSMFTPDVAEMQATYMEHHARFAAHDERLSELLETMKKYAASIGGMMLCGEELAEQLVSFYRPNAKGRAVVERFCEQHKKLGQEYSENLEGVFQRQVIEPVEQEIQADLREVKQAVAARNGAYEEVGRLHRLLARRKYLRLTDPLTAERRLKEAKDRLSLLQSDAMQRFDTVERRLGTRLYGCLRKLAAFQQQFARYFATATSEVLQAVVSEEPIVTGEARFAVTSPPSSTATPRNQPLELETWDDRYDRMEADTSPRTATHDQNSETTTLTTVSDEIDLQLSPDALQKHLNSVAAQPRPLGNVTRPANLLMQDSLTDSGG